jgi:hypothetical protein
MTLHSGQPSASEPEQIGAAFSSQAVRDRGLSALDEVETRERLQRCDDAAIAEIDHWLLKRGISTPPAVISIHFVSGVHGT